MVLSQGVFKRRKAEIISPGLLNEKTINNVLHLLLLFLPGCNRNLLKHSTHWREQVQSKQIHDQVQCKNNISQTNQDLDETFTMLSNELLDHLLYSNITMTELKIALMVVREVLGYHLNQKIIKTESFLKHCRLSRQNFNRAMKGFLRKGLIERTEVNGDRGEFNYFFSERLVSVINCSKKIRYEYFYAGKVIHNPKPASSDRLRQRHQPDDAGDIKVMTPSDSKNPPKQTPVADSETSEKNSKEILKKENKFLRGGIEESFTLSNTESGSKDWTKKPSSYEQIQKIKRQLVEITKQEQIEKAHARAEGTL